MSATAKLSLVEYEQIVASGVFDWPNQRHIELIRGELRDMNPIGPDHADIVDSLAAWSVRSLPTTIRVRVRNPLAFADIDSEPEPDLVWTRRRNPADGHPTASDVLLVIEVADSSIERDRTEKASLYAEAGIREFWIVNLIERTIEVYRDPSSSGYLTQQTFAADAPVRPLAAPTLGLRFEDLTYRAE
jgi:Uma2 family endonuclease